MTISINFTSESHSGFGDNSLRLTDLCRTEKMMANQSHYLSLTYHYKLITVYSALQQQNLTQLVYLPQWDAYIIV